MKITAILLLLGTAFTAHASRAEFQQDGWSLGGPLRVTFAGDDVDNDGALSLPELTQFLASWTTPLNEQIVWLLPDLEPDGFLFVSLDDYVFFARSPEFSLVSASFEGEALSSVFDQFLFPVDSSASPPTTVPEPGSLLLAGLGCLSLRFLRIRTAAQRRTSITGPFRQP